MLDLEVLLGACRYTCTLRLIKDLKAIFPGWHQLHFPRPRQISEALGWQTTGIARELGWLTACMVDLKFRGERSMSIVLVLAVLCAPLMRLVQCPCMLARDALLVLAHYRKFRPLSDPA